MSKKANNDGVVNYEERMLGKNLHFAAAEAYKLLRTNLSFSIREGEKCKVVGITSAEKGEGKSTTSINLAYTIAETGKNVLLIECDMRLPNIGTRLGLKKSMGLSNLLAGQEKPSDVLQHSRMLPSLFVITAGSVPPNPSELLSSEKMQSYIEAFKNSFNFIILDLPPVNLVSDALVVSRLVDGFVFVVREEYATKRSFKEAMTKFNVSTSKILGIVMTDVTGKEGGYAKKYKK